MHFQCGMLKINTCVYLNCGCLHRAALDILKPHGRSCIYDSVMFRLLTINAISF